ncbi:hypothetical protein SELMODRAFT_424678 [Selaginella moellendorffii]|uniref:Uncharacterized protein n=1 Tax=Selaginella moellendorffii TaxID=88036 RepID=D8SQP9_SELML|nr:hypothetical protein SELMODRAFT_424678 [Selaginella moellendorffii]
MGICHWFEEDFWFHGKRDDPATTVLVFLCLQAGIFWPILAARHLSTWKCLLEWNACFTFAYLAFIVPHMTDSPVDYLWCLRGFSSDQKCAIDVVKDFADATENILPEDRPVLKEQSMSKAKVLCDFMESRLEEGLLRGISRANRNGQYSLEEIEHGWAKHEWLFQRQSIFYSLSCVVSFFHLAYVFWGSKHTFHHSLAFKLVSITGGDQDAPLQPFLGFSIVLEILLMGLLAHVVHSKKWIISCTFFIGALCEIWLTISPNAFPLEIVKFFCYVSNIQMGIFHVFDEDRWCHGKHSLSNAAWTIVCIQFAVLLPVIAIPLLPTWRHVYLFNACLAFVYVVNISPLMLDSPRSYLKHFDPQQRVAKKILKDFADATGNSLPADLTSLEQEEDMKQGASIALSLEVVLLVILFVYGAIEEPIVLFFIFIVLMFCLIINGHGCDHIFHYYYMF